MLSLLRNLLCFLRSMAKRPKPTAALVGMIKNWESKVPAGSPQTTTHTSFTSTKTTQSDMFQSGGISDNEAELVYVQGPIKVKSEPGITPRVRSSDKLLMCH